MKLGSNQYRERNVEKHITAQDKLYITNMFDTILYHFSCIKYLI